MIDQTPRPRAAFAIAGLLIVGCTTDPSAARLTGTWAAHFGFPGSSFIVALEETNGQVAGQGCYAIEAGPGGRLTVTGTRAGAATTLTISWFIDGQAVPTRTVAFDVRLTDRDLVLTGTEPMPNGPLMLVLQRIPSAPQGC